MQIEINYKIIITILILSSSAGLLYNSLSSKGIPLIYKDTKSWAVDSSLNINSEKDIISSENQLPETLAEKKEPVVKVPVNVKQEEENKPAKPKYITLKQAVKLYESGSIFIDARDKWDFSDGHIKNAINIPYYKFDEQKDILESIPHNKTIVTYCDGDDCEASRHLADALIKEGYKTVYVFFGGWSEWTRSNNPVEKQE